MMQFRSRYFFATALLAIVAGIGVASPGTAHAANYSFGITNSGLIYQIDLINKTESLIFNTGFPGAGASDGPNGLAWDEASKSLYYRKSGSSNSGLYRVNLSGATPVQTQVATLTGSLTAGASGAIFNNSYWYITEDTSTLVQVSNLTNPTGVTVSPHANFDGDAYTGKYSFGDITIKSNGVMYGKTTTGIFFTADISGIASGASIATNYLSKSIAGSRQLTFGQDGKLYSHDTSSGKFYTVNLTSGSTFGNETLYSNGITPTGSTTITKFNDLSDSTPTQAIPEGSTAALIGLALPLIGMVALHRRKK